MNEGKLLDYHLTADFPLTGLEGSLQALETAVLLLDGGKVNHCRYKGEEWGRIEIEVYDSTKEDAVSLCFMGLTLKENHIKAINFYSYDIAGCLTDPTEIAAKLSNLCGKI